MKIEDYTPYVSVLYVPKNELDAPIPALIDKRLNFISELFEMPAGEYLLSMSNPKCTISKEQTKDFGQSMYVRKGDLMKYYLPNAIVTVGKDSVDSVALLMLNSCKHMFDLLNTNTPAFSEPLIQDIKFTLTGLFTANGLNHHLPIG